MLRFALGFVLGVAAAAVAASLLWPEPTAAPPVPAADAGASSEHDGEAGAHAGPNTDDTTAPPVERRHTAPRSAGPAQAAATDGESAPVAALRRLTEEGEWIRLRNEVRGLRRERPLLPIPRDLVVDIWTQGVVAASDAFAHEAARTALRSWREELLVRELAGITHGDPAFAVLADLSDELAASLAERPHAVHDLSRLLLTSEEARLRRAGLHLAATGARPQIDVVAATARDDPDEDTRCAAITHLVNRSRYDDPVSRAAAGALAVEIFSAPGSTRRARGTAIKALPHGGEPGLDIAQRLVVAGGLDDDDRRVLLEGLVDARRLPVLIESAASNRDLRLHLCEAVFESSEPSLSDVLALWPYVPHLMDAPHQDWAEDVPDVLLELGRTDLVEELARNERLSDDARAQAIWDLSCDDGHPRRALTLARALLEDASTTSTLRRGIIEAFPTIDYVDPTLRAELRALATRIAADDPNEWVRADAAAFLRDLDADDEQR